MPGKKTPKRLAAELAKADGLRTFSWLCGKHGRQPHSVRQMKCRICEREYGRKHRRFVNEVGKANREAVRESILKAYRRNNLTGNLLLSPAALAERASCEVQLVHRVIKASGLPKVWPKGWLMGLSPGKEL